MTGADPSFRRLSLAAELGDGEGKQGGRRAGRRGYSVIRTVLLAGTAETHCPRYASLVTVSFSASVLMVYGWFSTDRQSHLPPNITALSTFTSRLSFAKLHWLKTSRIMLNMVLFPFPKKTFKMIDICVNSALTIK